MIRVLLASLLGMFLVSSARADEAADLAVLKKAGIDADGPALLKFLKTAVPTDGGADEIAPLIKKMSSEDFFEREEAFKKVLVLGPRAVPFLRQALKESDRELVQRAEECLKVIEGGPGLDVHGAVLRITALRKPAGAATTLLEYIPFAPNERIVEEAALALKETAMVGGKVDPAILKALDDKFPSRRGVAAEALAQVDYKSHRDALLKRLKDDDPTVRFKTGLALALKHEKDAIPTLIDLLEKGSNAQAATVETTLQKLAEYKGPTGPFAVSKAKRDAWAGWWTANAATVDLARLTTIPKMLGRTLLIHASAGKVNEIDEKGNVVWEIAGLQFPSAAQMVGDDQVLILETRLRRVTLRNTKGELLRTFTVTIPQDMQVLPGGGFLVTIRLAAIEYDRNGKQVKRTPLTGNPSISARRTPTGDLYTLTAKGEIIKYNNAGKEVSRFPVGIGGVGTGFDVTPEGHILLASTFANKVVEFDASGKARREWKVPGATSAVRLPNGNTLVACGGAEKVVEINDRGAVVWEFSTKGSAVTRASKR